MGATVAYVCREQVKDLLDVKATAIADARIDDAILSATEAINGDTHRENKPFYPWHGTRSFDWPNWDRSSSWRLWLDPYEAISLTEVVSGGSTLDPADYFLSNPGTAAAWQPPYSTLNIDQATAGAFSAGSSWQRSVSLTGIWNYGNDTAPAGALEAGAPGTMDATQTTVTVTDSSVFTGVRTLDLIKINSEYMIVTGRAPVDTGQAVTTSALTAMTNDNSVGVVDSSVFTAGEQILIGAESMLVTRVIVNGLIVKRAVDGSTLAAHALAAPIYADRTLTIERGAVGTTAATHAAGTAVFRHKPPALVQSLARALAVNEFLQQSSGYARTTGSGDNEREASGKALAMLWKQVCQRYGTQARASAI